MQDASPVRLANYNEQSNASMRPRDRKDTRKQGKKKGNVNGIRVLLRREVYQDRNRCSVETLYQPCGVYPQACCPGILPWCTFVDVLETILSVYRVYDTRIDRPRATRAA